MENDNQNLKRFLLLTAQRLRDLQYLNQPLSLAFAVDEACFIWHGSPVGGEIIVATKEDAKAFPLLSFEGPAFDRWTAGEATLATLLESGAATFVNGDKLPRRMDVIRFFESLEADRMALLEDASLSFATAGLKLHRLTVTPDKHLTFNNPKPGTLLLPLTHDVSVAWLHFPSVIDQFVDSESPDVQPVRHAKTAQELNLYRLPQGLLDIAAKEPCEVLIFDLV